MGMLEDLKNCKSCAERREAMKKYMGEFMAWSKRPFGGRPPFPPGMPDTAVASPPDADGVVRYQLGPRPAGMPDPHAPRALAPCMFGGVLHHSACACLHPPAGHAMRPACDCGAEKIDK